MYIKEMKFSNFGPLRDVNFVPRFDSEGKPILNIILGMNGSGKTLFLSTILDAIIEFKRTIFSSIPEVEKNDLLKIASSAYISSGEDFYLSRVAFKEGEYIGSYFDFVSKVQPSELLKTKQSFFANFHDFPLKNVKELFYKAHTVKKEALEKIFDTGVYLYFPHSRFDHPAWLHKKNEIGFSFKRKYSGINENSVIAGSQIDEIQSWILDVVLDRQIYEMLLEPMNIDNQRRFVFDGYFGRNTNIIRALNEILTLIFQAKSSYYKSACIDISEKNPRTISVNLDDGNEKHKIASSLSQLSSGEQILFSLFAEIVRNFDMTWRSQLPFQLEEIPGIVVIDEADLHLHIDLQRRVLPALIKKFEKIQFFISTHSPFLVSGLASTLSDKVDFLALPAGEVIYPQDFDEMKIANEIFVADLDQRLSELKSLKDSISKASKPMVVTVKRRMD